MKYLVLFVIALCLALPATSQEREQTTATTVTEFRIKQLPENEANPNDRIGTTVLLELFNQAEGEPLTGAVIDSEKITFTDSTGKDLFAAGKTARLEYDKTKQVFGGMRATENRLSINPSRYVGRDQVRPGVVYLRCHALATPAEEATSVRIKGEIDIYTETKETKTITLTEAQLTAREGVELGQYSMKLSVYGAGSVNGRGYTTYEVDSLTALKQVTIGDGEPDQPSPVVLEGQTLKIYDEEIENTDRIELTYALLKKSTLALDLEITPGSVGR